MGDFLKVQVYFEKRFDCEIIFNLLFVVIYQIYICYYYDLICIFCNIFVLYLKYIYIVCIVVYKLYYKGLK